MCTVLTNQQTKPPKHNPPKRHQPPTRNLPKRNQQSARNLPKRNRRGGACVPVRTSAQRRFHTKNMRIVRGEFNDECALAGRHGRVAAFPCQKYTHCARGFERRMRPCWVTRAGTQAPPLPISIIFFHAIPHKQNNLLRTIIPNETNHLRVICPNETVGVVPVCPPERQRSGVSIRK